MPIWAWIVIAVGAVALVALIGWQITRQQRSRKLRGQFGPEYQRTVSAADSKREAEAELAERRKRREKLDIRPLSVEERSRYSQEWQEVQAQFVDDPSGAVMRADTLIQSVMADRGYPMEDFEQRAADVSVDHPHVVQNYRTAHDIAVREQRGEASTEDLRKAMVHYRALFDDLLDTTDVEPREVHR